MTANSSICYGESPLYRCAANTQYIRPFWTSKSGDSQDVEECRVRTRREWVGTAGEQ